MTTMHDLTATIISAFFILVFIFWEDIIKILRLMNGKDE